MKVALYRLSSFYLCTYEYMCISMYYVTIIMKIDTMNLKEGKDGYMRGFGGRKRKEEVM